MSKKLSFDLLDRVLSSPEEDEPCHNWEKLKKVLLYVLRDNVTERQRQMLILYFFKHKNIPEIAQLLHVNKSTVSRTITRGISNIRKYLKYYDLR